MILAIVEEKIQPHFLSLKQLALPTFEEKLKIDFLTKIQYKIPPKKIISYEQAKCSAQYCFQAISLDDFCFLFFAFLLENTIIFFSEDQRLLNTSMSFSL